MRSFIAVMIIIFVSILGPLSLLGCNESKAQVEAITFDTSAEEILNPILAEEGSGSEVRVIFITSYRGLLGRRPYNLRDSEVKAEIAKIVNSGEYDVITVETIYSSGYLISAEIWYRVQQE